MLNNIRNISLYVNAVCYIYPVLTVVVLCIYCRRALGALQRTLDRIRNDLGVKNNSLQVEQQCMVVRESLAQHPHSSELAKPAN